MEVAKEVKYLSIICTVAVFVVFYIGQDIESYSVPPVYLNISNGNVLENNIVKNTESDNNTVAFVSKISNTYKTGESKYEIKKEKILREDVYVPLTSLSEEQMKMKKILVWHYAYSSKGCIGYGYGNLPFLYDNCEEPRCIITDNKTLLPVTDYDALIFHLRGIDQIQLPVQRVQTQRWILYEMESASYVFENPARYNRLFNWTMTYRRDSDIHFGYGYFEPLKKPSTNIILRNYTKPKMAAWFVSNCRSMSNRENIVKGLRKYLTVDIYGKCGNHSCMPQQDDKCYDMVEENYKFYLSFENSYCKDYVTEKLYNVLRYNIVPIVFGNANYSEIAPPYSYIDVRNFDTVKDLAKYLIYLENNITAYNEYFKWKEKYRILSKRETIAKTFCALCKSLHAVEDQKVYTDIADWFITKGECKRFQPLSYIEKLLGIGLAK